MKFCYVILHYRTEEDTVLCVESMKKATPEADIVIVDNASKNGSIERLIKLYGKDKQIHIIQNKENLGFASGNNVGYFYAKNTLKADFIAVSNNDIVVDTLHLDHKVAEIYEREQFHLLGPDIVSLIDGHHQNPMLPKTTSVKKINREINRYRLLLLISRLGVYDLLKPKEKKTTSHFDLKDSEIGVQLHGSFVIFSPIFIAEENMAFREGTFLYMEEAILSQYCRKKGYKTIFDPEIRVYHKEDSSTNSIFDKGKEKREFVFKHMIQSLCIYRSLLKG